MSYRERKKFKWRAGRRKERERSYRDGMSIIRIDS